MTKIYQRALGARNAIPVDQPQEMVAAYKCAGAVVDLTPISGAGHVFDDATRDGQITAGIRFLHHHLTAPNGPKS